MLFCVWAGSWVLQAVTYGSFDVGLFTGRLASGNVLRLPDGLFIADTVSFWGARVLRLGWRRLNASRLGVGAVGAWEGSEVALLILCLKCFGFVHGVTRFTRFLGICRRAQGVVGGRFLRIVVPCCFGWEAIKGA